MNELLKIWWRALISRQLALVLALSLSFSAAWSAKADNPYLAKNYPDGIALLAPPPPASSAEEAADLDTVRDVFRHRTEAEKARAIKDYSIALALFEPIIGPVFVPGNLPKTEAMMLKVKKEVGEVIDTPKNHWKRLRPYQLDPTLNLGSPENSFSYPSGHSTRGTLYALLLAELFPAQKDKILEIGRQIGWDRVLIGKHYPTDIYAGRVLGQAIAHELLATPAFQHDLAEAKAEIEAAKTKSAGSGSGK